MDIELCGLIAERLREVERDLARALLTRGNHRAMESTDPSLEAAISAALSRLESLRITIEFLIPAP